MLYSQSAFRAPILRSFFRTLAYNTFRNPQQLSVGSKILLSIGAYSAATLSVARVVERKNIGYVFRQLGEK